MEIIVISILSYLMGSIPFGFILTKIFLKKDIRDIGSGNIGATNALRTGNKSLGYGTFFLDIIKAVIPVIYVKLNYPDYIFIASLCTFLGHVFPIWLKFNGGKGVATYVGILFSINLTIGFVFVGVWIFYDLIALCVFMDPSVYREEVSGRPSGCERRHRDRNSIVLSSIAKRGA